MKRISIQSTKIFNKSLKNIEHPFKALSLSYKSISFTCNHFSSLNKSIIDKSKMPGLYNFQKFNFSPLPPHQKLALPNLSPSMETGGIAEWKKKEGDQFKPGDAIAAIETDKAVVDFEVNESGYIAKILKPVGTKNIPLGEIIVITVDKKSDVEAFKNYSIDGSSSEPAKEVKKEEAKSTTQTTSKPGKSYPPHQKLALPNLSPSMETGGIAEWKKKEGDQFKPGDAIAAIETDKAVVDFEVNESGYIAKILKPVGTKNIPLGEIIVITVDKKSDVEAFKDFTLESMTETSTTTSSNSQQETQKAEAVQQPKEAEVKDSNRIFVSPLAKKTSAENNVNLSDVKGTGPNSRIIQADVLEHLSKEPKKVEVVKSEVKQSQPVTGNYADIPVSQIRKVIATRLLQSKTTIPHFYLNAECKVDKLLSLREKLNKVSPVKISVNDIIVKAVAVALDKVPEANSTWMDTHIRMNKSVDVSVAVQTDTGLITPIVFNANTKRIGEISKDIKELAAKAKEGKLKPQEFQGGTFTVSNLGMFGITSFSAIINPGQSCILAVGASEKKVVVNEKSKDDSDKFKVESVINVTLSCDHRTVDGAVGAKWVNEFKKLMEDPDLLLL